MSAPELPPELAGHLAVLTDKSDAHAKARAATANASGNAHAAAESTVRGTGGGSYPAARDDGEKGGPLAPACRERLPSPRNRPRGHWELKGATRQVFQ